MAYSYKTSITFGFVFIPIELFAVIKNTDISFNMIHKKTKQRIQYKKTCLNCEDNVNSQDIVRGFEYNKDEYATFTNEEFNKLKTKKDKNVTIMQFANLDDIDPIFYDRSFYVVPTNAFDAYNLMAEVMSKQKKVAIAKTVLGNKEVLVSIRSKNGALILSTLFFFEEVQPQPYKIEKPKNNEKELTVAKALVSAMEKDFEPKEFIDEFKIRLEKAIEQKINGKQIQKVSEVKTPNKVINLMNALQKSLNAKTKQSLKKQNVFVMPKRKKKVKATK
jgi:DNA end-binding protein Ku